MKRVKKIVSNVSPWDGVRSSNLVWLDLEMTGLDPKKCCILEIGTLITDSELNVVAEGPMLAIHQPDRILDTMDTWCRIHHGKSGLTEACRKSKISLRKAEDLSLEFVKRYCVEKNAPLCGNTVWQDRRFLIKYMPRLERYLHYRVIDVSSVKELVGRWYPKKEKRICGKKNAHRVEADIRESIDELTYYREEYFC